MTKALQATELDHLRDMLERLRAVESSTLNMSDSVTTCWHRNPDGPTAADTIESLLSSLSAANAVVEEARGVLEPLLKGWSNFTEDGWGNHAEAYYSLAKGMSSHWTAAAAFLARHQENGCG